MNPLAAPRAGGFKSSGSNINKEKKNKEKKSGIMPVDLSKTASLESLAKCSFQPP